MLTIPALLTLTTVAFLDSLLSVDNALVLAVLVKHLPPAQQTRALTYGIFGAYIMRGLSLFLVSFAIHFWPIRLIGGGYLVYLGVSHLRSHEEDESGPRNRGAGFWMTVAQVELLDLIFSLDNILATVALSQETWVVILGVCISILAIRFVAGIFLKLLDRFPILRLTAYLIVVFIGLKLLVSLLGFELGEVSTFGVILLLIAGSLAWERWMAKDTIA
ncbi:MAG: DUF475 domain-containing protein [Anaerolineae bacterium]|nr:DUF475 domain-containing protein [Anaerolineae bacterium]